MCLALCLGRVNNKQKNNNFSLLCAEQIDQTKHKTSFFFSLLLIDNLKTKKLIIFFSFCFGRLPEKHKQYVLILTNPQTPLQVFIFW